MSSDQRSFQTKATTIMLGYLMVDRGERMGQCPTLQLDTGKGGEYLVIV